MTFSTEPIDYVFFAAAALLFLYSLFYWRRSRPAPRAHYGALVAAVFLVMSFRDVLELTGAVLLVARIVPLALLLALGIHANRLQAREEPTTH